jgi:hypothetical protein
VSDNRATRLADAVERMARLVSSASDTALDRAWAWQDYHSEGARFAAFVSATELAELVVRIGAERRDTGCPPSLAQRILAPYHASWHYLNAVLLGVDDDEGERVAAAGAWSARQTLAHIVEADATFYAVIRYGYERAVQGLAPARAPNEYYDALLGTEAAFAEQMAQPLGHLWRLYAQHHARVLGDLGTIGDQWIETPLLFWEEQVYPLRFRLHRFDAHLQQHTIQIEMMLGALHGLPGEGQYLARMLCRALADVESALLGTPEILLDARVALAETIEQRSGELAAVLA